MAAITVSHSVTLPWLVRRGLLALWSELPRWLVAGALTLAALLPLAVSWATHAPLWLLAVTSVPPALVGTGSARLAAATVRGEAARPSLLLRVDPVLALGLAGLASLAGAMGTAGPAGAVAGAGLGATVLVVAPYALAYGALRERAGLLALRGGLILVAYRPAWALTLLSLGVLAGFAVVASAGVLAFVVAPLLAVVATSIVAGLLDEIDSHGGVG